jgi:hypothetical protein
MLAILFFLLIIYKIGGLFYTLQSIVLILNIITTEYIISYYPELLIPRWIRILSYIILYIIIIILINDLWTQWV